MVDCPLRFHVTICVCVFVRIMYLYVYIEYAHASCENYSKKTCFLSTINKFCVCLLGGTPQECELQTRTVSYRNCKRHPHSIALPSYSVRTSAVQCILCNSVFVTPDAHTYGHEHCLQWHVPIQIELLRLLFRSTVFVSRRRTIQARPKSKRILLLLLCSCRQDLNMPITYRTRQNEMEMDSTHLKERIVFSIANDSFVLSLYLSTLFFLFCFFDFFSSSLFCLTTVFSFSMFHFVGEIV